MSTIKVFWKGKFGGRAVAIDAAAFDPAVRRHEADGGWEMPAKQKPEPVPQVEASGLTVAEPITDEPKPTRRKASK